MSVEGKNQPACAETYRPRQLHERIGDRVPSGGLAGRLRKRLGPFVARCLSSRRALAATLPLGERVVISPSHRHITWNPAEYAAFRAATRPGGVVLDIGANVGAYTVLFGQWVGAAGRVYAFEPDPEAMRGLRTHVTLNQLDDRVTSIERIVLDRAATSVPFRCEPSSGLGRLDRGPVTSRTVVRVAAESIDGFCEAAGVIPTVIKIDAEGAELFVLEGARRTIARAGSRLQLFVEMHPARWGDMEYDLPALQQECERQGLTPEAIHGNGAGVWANEGICVRLRGGGS